jgi:hypothetical protein
MFRRVDKHHQQLADIAKRYPDEYLACRAGLGHSWEPESAAWLQNGTIERVLVCKRCTAKRVQILDADGYIVGGHYTYADGYTIKGVGPLDTADRAALRRTHVMRLMG